MRNIDIDCSHSIWRYLGIILDENFSWKENTEILCKKLSRSVGILAKLRHYISYKTLISICYSIFHSHILYHLPVFGKLNVDQMNKISNLQRKAFRIMHFKKQTDSIILPLFLKAKILPIEKQLKVVNCLLAYDQLKNNLPLYFNDFLETLGINHSRLTKAKQLAFKIAN